MISVNLPPEPRRETLEERRARLALTGREVARRFVFWALTLLILATLSNLFGGQP